MHCIQSCCINHTLKVAKDYVCSRYARPAEKRAAPPRPAKRQALPHPAEIDKTRGARRGKADCRLHRSCQQLWAYSGEMKEKLFIWYFVQLVIIIISIMVILSGESGNENAIQVKIKQM